jgi:hypothetical protein
VCFFVLVINKASISALVLIQLTCFLNADTTINDFSAQWLLDGNANDSRGNSNGSASNITYEIQSINGIPTTVAKFGQSSGITVAKSSYIDLGTSFSLTAKVKINSWIDSSVNGGYVIVSAGGFTPIAAGATSYGAGITAWSMDMNMHGSGGEYSYTRSYSAGASLNTDNVPSENLGLDISQWHQLVWVYDGTNIKNYLDGVALNSLYSAQSGFNIDPYTDFDVLRIGYDHAGIGVNPSLDGYLSDIRIYKFALTGAQVAAIPEPSTFSLLAIGLGGLAILRRRR